ncbi:n-acetylgalactosamine kinase [Caerostris extrusa]|uniref:N-acetylgalactosamine kinase n=1 Tax=Caerostris extrusa TaxID=172846 RepID=A0AAV4NWN0_CAEEX|nr:n-acetylgalactosamine kinase [Caerostris extrusa]
MDVLVRGTVPPSAGLSSSSALVCASALATTYVNRIFLEKSELASACAVSERYIGTQGGGMDQAIGFLAESGKAKLIEFNPIRTSNVPLPLDVVFVVSNSCVAMNKAATSQFNRRVIECRLAAKVLAKKHGFEWQEVQKLAEIPVLLEKDISDMKSVIEHDLSQKSYSRNELCSILDITDDEFMTILSDNTRHLESFQLLDRAKHVFEEAARVRKFKAICERDNNEVHELGRLMNESHQSCRDLYECSHPILDELVKTALDAGAIGSRLTGAGWGGCCVSLVMKNNVDHFMEFVKKNFYEKRVEECPGIDVNCAMFVTKPSEGAAVYTLEV